MSGETPTKDLNDLADAPLPWKPVDWELPVDLFLEFEQARDADRAAVLAKADRLLRDDPNAWTGFKASVRRLAPKLVPESWGSVDDDRKEHLNAVMKRYEQASSSTGEAAA